MATFYIREKSHRATRGTWLMVTGTDAESVKRRYIREQNNLTKRRYSDHPDILKSRLLKLSDVSVRQTPPLRGDIATRTKKSGTEPGWDFEDRYIPRSSTPTRARSKIKTRLADIQLDLLIKTSQKLRQPLHYSDDLYKHDRRILHRYNPQSFIWVIRELGTHLYILDKRGQPAAPGTYQSAYSLLEFHMRNDRPCKFYLVSGKTIKSLTGDAARAKVLREFKKAYPKMRITSR